MLEPLAHHCSVSLVATIRSSVWNYLGADFDLNIGIQVVETARIAPVHRFPRTPEQLHVLSRHALHTIRRSIGQEQQDGLSTGCCISR
jgi:hypothetical protein